MKDFNEYFSMIKRWYNNINNSSISIPSTVFNDGYTASIQASNHHYSEPREDWKEGIEYTQFEIGFPSTVDDILLPYGEANFEYDDDDNEVELLPDIFPYTPIEVINKLIEIHKGIDIDKMKGNAIINKLKH